MEWFTERSDPLRACPDCGRDLPLGALACPACDALVYGADLNRISQQAKTCEEKGDRGQARALWNHVLTLLPADSGQAAWVRARLQVLDAVPAQGAPPPAPATPNWVRRLGPLAPVALLLLKGKGLWLALFKLKFLFSFLTFAGLYWGLYGWRLGVGFAVCILIHEFGHYIDIKRRGLPAELPVFLPFFAAYVRWDALGVTRRQIAQVSLAGPLAGGIAALASYGLYLRTGAPVWVVLASWTAWLNVLNLVPVWNFDGSKATDSLSRPERIALALAALTIAAVARQGIFLFVCAGAVYRIFGKDHGKEQPLRDDWSTLAYFVAVLAALALLLHVVGPSLPHRL